MEHFSVVTEFDCATHFFEPGDQLVEVEWRSGLALCADSFGETPARIKSHEYVDMTVNGWCVIVI